ncbi:Pkinase-domain-containing protein [Polychaeton citri CBS 116435]|uniref:Pkinase-domain-containing protein n=1 Tax=Polychaeton citri CBS 116435 TaxID=1314669 RepID=A0A9P4ULQ0_9PEZI|nr:Pkinase-domain-containing protein [Polychaeton citri CBS 116435]
MTVAYDASYRGWPTSQPSALCLEDKYEILKDIGDGSFGSVQLGRVRSAGAQTVRRGTMVAIKTMKKSFDSFAQCMELREVIFLKALPNHPHLVPAFDIFLDPLSKKLHISMEYMDGNLYQLMKSRDHKPFDCQSVKSILFQIMGGLEHIHEHSFFHRDIKPENILVSTSAPDTGNSFRRYSAMMTPPSTPPAYSVKIADFGLARETHSRVPYTTYVSTRWYRAPEVLLRAGEYSAPVDIWAIGAMAVEIATLKPLFPGGNEVDQVWRVCEIMGSPGSWVNKQGQRVGGGEWKDGIRLAQKLGFSFPKMAPHSLETHLPPPHWPASLAHFVTWCLMWDPKSRPTSRQALEHDFFTDATDPLKSTARLNTPKALGRKTSNVATQDTDMTHGLATKTSSWFRKSLGGGVNTANSPDPAIPTHAATVRPAPIHASSENITIAQKPRPAATKRATWANGAPSNGAPIPILPSIRPVSPLPDSTTAQASSTRQESENRNGRKVGRQLSVASHGNHYADLHRQEAERALEGGNGLKSPTGSQREGFFSHLRKRARRLSGRNQAIVPSSDDVEANAGCAPWVAANRQPAQDVRSLAPQASDPSADPQFAELDKALNNVRYSLDVAAASANPAPKAPSRFPSNPSLKRHHSLPYGMDVGATPAQSSNNPGTGRTRKSLRQPNQRYETPDEEEELLDEAMNSAARAARQLHQEPQAESRVTYQQSRPPNYHHPTEQKHNTAYLTPSQSKETNGVSFGAHEHTSVKPMDIPPMRHKKSNVQSQWPTPPYEENDWAAAAAASIFATQAQYQ